MQIFRAHEHKTTRWKNGGGSTTQIAVFPAGASLDNFDWRVSMARIETDGPFSIFAGIDRTLAILEGDGLRLTIGDDPIRIVGRDSEPVCFRADIAARAERIGGEVTDLNVMVRRGRWRHRVRRILCRAPQPLSVSGEIVLLLCAAGSVGVETRRSEARLGPRDALLERHGASVWEMRPDGEAEVYLIEISPATGGGMGGL